MQLQFDISPQRRERVAWLTLREVVRWPAEPMHLAQRPDVWEPWPEPRHLLPGLPKVQNGEGRWV